MFDRQNFVDRMLETENLTDELEDEPAKWLINWGVEKIDIVTDGIDDEELASEQVGNLMRFMRRLNRIAGNMDSLTAEDLRELLDRHTSAFGASRTASEEEMTETAGRLSSMSPFEVLEFLITWAQASE